MCKMGDIIVVKNCKRDDKDIGQHSFVVLSTDKGEIEGLSYDLVTNIMSSFDGKGVDYKNKKLSFPENIPYSAKEENVKNGNHKEGFIKAGVLFYFDRDKTDFFVIGNIEIDLYLRLLEYINNSDNIIHVIDNLKP